MTGVESAATIVDLLAARRRDDSIGLRHDDKSWTWREVVAASERYASRFARERRPGPFHVGLLLDNVPEYLFALFGCALAGAVAVGVNSTRRGEELAHDIRHTDCQFLLTSSATAASLAGLDLGGATVFDVRSDAWRASVEATEPVAGPVDVRPDDLFTFIFTSGSTGAPKAVQMTHSRAARMAAAATWFGSDDVLYCAMPLFHGNALNAVVFPALATGATIALRDRFSASAFMPDVRRYGATFFSTVGRALSYILATPTDPLDREHAVKFALAPESSPADVSAFRKRFGIFCVTGYGSSENAVIFVPVAGMPKDALGGPQEGLDAAIVDPDTAIECPRARFDEHGRLLNGAEAIGEIVGRNVADRFEGYYKNPEADAARVRNGWYWTGDLGYRSDDDLFYFAGRSGEWLRVDSENFAVAPVERIVARFPSARGAVVFAVPDERTADDQVMAALELAPDTEFDPADFEQFLAEQADLGAKWAPRYVRITEALPVGATNKIDRRTLRAERWYTEDPVYWRPDRSSPYLPLTADDLAALERRFAEHGRAIDRP
jgi:fatty-acyl-CoA synthase